MSVEIRGAVLASLQYEISNAYSDQEGFLFGEIQRHKTDVISDSQISSVQEKIVIEVHSFLRCGVALSWYDNCGRTDMTKLRSCIGGLPTASQKNIIGWYKFRRNTSGSISMRERQIHKSLINTLDKTPGNFLFLICNADEMTGQSTHTFTQIFHTVSPSGIVTSLSCNILNLGDTAHNDYKREVSQSTGKVLTGITKKYRTQFLAADGQNKSVVNLQHLSRDVQKELQALCVKVANSETAVGELRDEVKSLRLRLNAQRALITDHHHGHLKASSSKEGQKQLDTKQPVESADTINMDMPAIHRSPDSTSPRTRKMNSYSDMESEFDLRANTPPETVPSHDTLTEQPHALETPDLISFDDTDTVSDNIQNLAIDTQKKAGVSDRNGFEDNFVMNVNNSSSYVPTGHFSIHNSTPPTTSFKGNPQKQLPAETQTLKQIAAGYNKQTSQPQQPINQLNILPSHNAPVAPSDLNPQDDPFAFIAEKQREICNKLPGGKPKGNAEKLVSSARATPEIISPENHAHSATKEASVVLPSSAIQPGVIAKSHKISKK